MIASINAITLQNLASNFTDCYVAQLSIIPVQDGDLRRDYRLRVTNANGATEEPFNLGNFASIFTKCTSLRAQVLRRR